MHHSFVPDKTNIPDMLATAATCLHANSFWERRRPYSLLLLSQSDGTPRTASMRVSVPGKCKDISFYSHNK